jgi:hypothetical protein
MTFQQKLLVVSALAVVVAMAVLSESVRTRSRVERGVALWLAVVSCALIGVGVVSHTLFRHLIQIIDTTPNRASICMYFTEGEYVAARPDVPSWWCDRPQELHHG